MEENTPSFEIPIDRGYGEKQIIIYEDNIEFSQDRDDTLIHKYEPDLIVFGTSGYPPPFEKGSSVLKSLRETTGQTFEEWTKLIPLTEDPNNEFRIFDGYIDDKKNPRQYWGIWLSKTNGGQLKADLLTLNFPFQLIKFHIEKNKLERGAFLETTSRLFRTLIAAIDAYKIFNLGDRKIKTILMSDIGGNMFPSENQKARITILREVFEAWLSTHPDIKRVVVAFGKQQDRKHRLLNYSDLWEEQAENSTVDEGELENAGDLRLQNAKLCRQIATKTTAPRLEKLTQCLLDSAVAFETSQMLLAPDALQARKLTEALSRELVERYGLKSTDSTLDSYIRRLEESKRVSGWMTSYMHVIRILGNEAAHYKKQNQMRPETPVGKDLTVIHAALGRVLNFCLVEF